jgi:hypothetical protein
VSDFPQGDSFPEDLGYIAFRDKVAVCGGVHSRRVARRLPIKVLLANQDDPQEIRAVLGAVFVDGECSKSVVCLGRVGLFYDEHAFVLADFDFDLHFVFVLVAQVAAAGFNYASAMSDKLATVTRLDLVGPLTCRWSAGVCFAWCRPGRMVCAVPTIGYTGFFPLGWCGDPRRIGKVITRGFTVISVATTTDRTSWLISGITRILRRG